MSETTPRKKREAQEAIGLTLARLRAKVGLKQAEAAAAAGLKQGTWSRYEKGSYVGVLERPMRLRLINALGVSEDDFDATYDRILAGDDAGDEEAAAPVFGRMAQFAPISQERTIFTEDAGPNVVRVAVTGELTHDLLEAVEQFLARQRKRMTQS